MSCQINYDKQPRRFLQKLDKKLAKRIINKIESLLENEAVPHSAKTIVGCHGVFRIRIGDYRVLYRVDYQKNMIVILNIDNRARIYQ